MRHLTLLIAALFVIAGCGGPKATPLPRELDKLVWKPQMVVFKDGSKLTVPD